jgi:hypothetical protein
VGKPDPEIVMTTEETTKMNNQTDKELHSMPTIAEIDEVEVDGSGSTTTMIMVMM